MRTDIQPIDCPERMISAIRRLGIVPFFRNSIPGWSVEELTDPDFWFTSSENLGPWDWKIDTVREGDIAYGKFLGGKAAFATVEYYRHLMNWRRSLPKYRAALGEDFPARTESEKLMKRLAPAALGAIRENGMCGTAEIRKAVARLCPDIRKSLTDRIVQYLEMGTWVVTGDFTRVYRGACLEYSGWQRSSLTTPDELFRNVGKEDAGEPFWARMFREQSGEVVSLEVDCTAEESRMKLAEHIAQCSGCSCGKEISRYL